MTRAPLALFGLLLSLFVLAAPAQAADKPLRVLYLDQSVGFVHGPVNRRDAPFSLSETTIIEVGKTSGAFTAEVTQDAREITPERLKTIDVLVLYTTGALPIAPANWQAIQEWVASGKGGFVGLHSATDTGWDYTGPGETYTQFINGKFAGHPWTMGTPIWVVAQDPKHPAVSMWPASFPYAEEIYQYSNYDPARVRVLQSLDMARTPLFRPYMVPITWVRQIGKGRLFYTNLGHTESTWRDPTFRAQIVAGVRWAGRRTKGAATPNPREQAFVAIHSLLAAEMARDAKGNDIYSGRDQASEISREVERLRKVDDAWLTATAASIARLRELYPSKPDSDRTRYDAAYKAVLTEVRAKISSAPRK